MKDFFYALIVIVILLAIFGEKDALYDIGSTLRQGIDAISDGYNGEPRIGEER